MSTWSRRLLGGLAASALLVAAAPTPASAQQGYAAVAGAGSSWSANMLSQWTADVKQFGIKVDYDPKGSSTGRARFTAGTVDYAVSEIPYGLTDAQGGFDAPPDRGFAYLPIVAGGTSFMYNLTIAGKRVTNLRLSGDVISRIFTGVITSWDDPAIAADNPALALPARTIVPVVRSDGSGTTAQFTTWMAKEHQNIWGAFCEKVGVGSAGSCPFTSVYPSISGFRAQAGSDGVANYVSTPTAEGAITYVEYSYALGAKFPVAKVLNSSGVYVEPTDQAVAVGLLAAQINNDKADKNNYLTQRLDGVYRNADPRSYPLSSYSYMIIPTAEAGTFKADKGRSLGDFLNYSVCEGQQAASVLGYSPLPQNLVVAGLEQIRLIPGVDLSRVDLTKCNNPTFSADGTNTLAVTAPQPPDCDKKGPAQCAEGTGGARGTATAVSNTASAGAGGAAAGGGAGGGGAEGTGAAGGSTPGAGTPGGAAGDPATAGAPGGPGAAVDPALVGGDVATVIDPETGEVLAAGGTSGLNAGLVSGIAVQEPGVSGGLRLALMLLAGLALVVGTVGPPLISRTLPRRPGGSA